MIDHKNGEHPFGDAGQIILFLLFMFIWAADSFIFRFSTFPAQYVPLYIRMVVSAAVFTGVIKLITLSHRAVGETRVGERKLQTDGVYSFVRHPMYMGILLFYESMIILTLSIAAFVFYLLIFLFYNHIAAFEEKVLEDEFPNDYLHYKFRKGRWIPGKG